MSNKPRRESVPTPADVEAKARARALADAPADNGRQRVLMLGGLAAAVVLAVVAAFALNAGDSDPKKDDTTATAAADGDTGGASDADAAADPASRETSAVELTGDPLATHDSDADPDEAIGSPAPSFVASTFDGTEVTIDPGDGVGRMIGFFAHWCPHCQREVPTVNQWAADGGVPEGVELVAVSTAVDATADNYPPSAWFETEGFPGTVVRDSDSSALANGYGLSGFPYWVVTDGSGNVVARASGEQSPENLSAFAALAQG